LLNTPSGAVCAINAGAGSCTTPGRVPDDRPWAAGSDEKGGAEAEPEEGDLDARVLAVARDPEGVRFRAFREGVDMLTQSTWAGWPISGPRTVLWCCRFIRDTDSHPRARHTHWKRDANVTASDAGVSDHEVAMRALEHALTYDQLNVSELSCLELLLRRAQLAELKHKGRVLRVESDLFGDDEYLYMGTGQTRGLLMICPALEEFVSGEMAKEGAVLKEREEKLLSRPKPQLPKGAPKGGPKGLSKGDAAGGGSPPP
jgi:hypothetical protein